ncbi:MAG: DsbA family protein [bacterium]|nr:DsbA family protein [bacterium]
MKYLWILLTIVVIIAGLVFFWPSSNDKTSNVNNNSDAAIEGGNTDATENVLIIGDEDAKVTIVEYGDFKCPTCTAFHQFAGAEIRQNYIEGGLVRILFRTLPIIGPDSPRAAQAAYCANEQGMFTEFHDSVFDYMHNNYYNAGNIAAEFQDILTTSQLKTLADSAELDSKVLGECVESGKFESIVKRDIEIANINGANGTPTFFVGDQKVTGFQQFSVFKTLIELQLNR